MLTRMREHHLKLSGSSYGDDVGPVSDDDIPL
jgi:hypothetical protein